jgi:hypothetical protein
MVTSGAVPSPEPSPGPPDLDFRGSRRLAGKEEWFWYLFAAVTYCGAATWEKFFLNWIMGPLWLVGVVVGGPALWDRIRRRPVGDESGGVGREP